MLRAQQLAARDVSRGVTLQMVRKSLGRNVQSRGEKENVTQGSTSDIDQLLATINDTECFEDQLRAKYNI